MFSLFGIVAFALVIAIVLAVFITKQPPPHPIQYAPVEDDFQSDPKSVRPLTLEDLYKVGEKIIESNKLTLKDKMPIDAREQYWTAESKNEIFFGTYVIGFHQHTAEDPYVSLSTILEFKDFIKSLSGARGLYITTGYFTNDVHQPLEGPKVNLYNRKIVVEEAAKLGVNLG